MFIGGIDVVYRLREKKKIMKSAKIQPVTTSAMAQKKARRKKLTKIPPLQSSENASQKNAPVVMKKLSQTLDRFNASDRLGAHVATAVLEDFGIVNSQNTSAVIDRSKVRRDRQKIRQDEKKSLDLKVPILSLYFDGRKDKTITLAENRRQSVTEEHIVLISEPGAKYVGHVVPESGTAANILKAITTYLTSESMSEESLCAIGCDGTNVNVGNKGGVITLWENHLGRPLQWLVCQLHANELPLRHLVNHLDGDTNGPRAFSGPIGKALADCNNLPVQKYSKIESVIPIVLTDLSWEQKYLYEMCKSVVSGVCSASLAKRNPGKLVHSRWVTTANRILRLYISSTTPSKNLIILATFVVKVYAPCWFLIKKSSSCIYGAQHIYESIQRSRYLPESLRDIIDPVLQRNAYFAHCENILLGMIFDKRQFVRELAFRRIKKARSAATSARKFHISPLNFTANDYIDLITWHEVQVTEPPLLSNLTEEELAELVLNPKAEENELAAIIRKLPCHIQATERAVKTVTEVSASVTGPVRRDGMIRNKIKARSIMPSFNTKKQYNTSN